MNNNYLDLTLDKFLYTIAGNRIVYICDTGERRRFYLKDDEIRNYIDKITNGIENERIKNILFDIEVYKIENKKRINASYVIKGAFDLSINLLKKKLNQHNTQQSKQQKPATDITIPTQILQSLENEKLITQNPLKWIGAVNLCAYFVDCYFSKSNPNNLWKVGETLFKVENLRKAKNNYLGNESTGGKPKGYKIIDTILQQNR